MDVGRHLSLGERDGFDAEPIAALCPGGQARTIAGVHDCSATEFRQGKCRFSVTAIHRAVQAEQSAKRRDRQQLAIGQSVSLWREIASEHRDFAEEGIQTVEAGVELAIVGLAVRSEFARVDTLQRNDVVHSLGRHHIVVRLAAAGRLRRTGPAEQRVRVAGQVIRRQRDRFETRVRAQWAVRRTRSIPRVNGSPPAQIRQCEVGFAVAAVGGPKQGKQRWKRWNRQQTSVRNFPADRSEAAREQRDFTQKRRTAVKSAVELTVADGTL